MNSTTEHKFSLGQSVRYLRSSGPGLNAIGTVVHVHPYDSYVGVSFPTFVHGHTCDNGMAPNASGWNCVLDDLELVKNTYEVGDKFIPNETLKSNCGCEWHRIDYIKITRNESGCIWYDTFNADDEYIERCDGHSEAFEEPMKPWISTPKVIADVVTPETMPTVNVGVGTTAVDYALPKDSPSVARVGWYDEPVFIPSTRVKPSETTEEYTPIYKTNTKYKPRADNIRKLMGLRNHKTRSAVKV